MSKNTVMIGLFSANLITTTMVYLQVTRKRLESLQSPFGSMETGGKIYRNLVIEASSQETDIWLGDDEGHLVQKEVGVLDTDVLEGHYTVEFGLGTTTYP